MKLYVVTGVTLPTTKQGANCNAYWSRAEAEAALCQYTGYPSYLALLATADFYDGFGVAEGFSEEELTTLAKTHGVYKSTRIYTCIVESPSAQEAR